MKTELKNSFITSVDFVNNTGGQFKLKLSHKYSYNVKYGKDNICRGEFVCEVGCEDNPDIFHLKFTCVGIFTYNPELTKEEIHVQTYNLLFPTASAFSVTLTANAGIPPLRIVPMDITTSNIYRIDLGGLSGQKGNGENG